MDKNLVTIDTIKDKILLVRSKRVILASDLASLYQVETKYLNKQVKRNIERFPESFCFKLSKEEGESLRFQIGTSKMRGGTRYLPYAFTEHGALMAANVLNSNDAIKMSILLINVFVEMKNTLHSQNAIFSRIATLEKKYGTHDLQIKKIFDAIKSLHEPTISKKRKIGFGANDDK